MLSRWLSGVCHISPLTLLVYHSLYCSFSLKEHHSPHLRSAKLCSTLRWWVSKSIIWGVFHISNIYSFPFMHSHQYQSVYVYFIPWIRIQLYFILLFSNCGMRRSFIWLVFSFDIIPSIFYVLFYFVTSFLETQHSPWLSNNSCPVLVSATSARSPGSSYWRTGLKTQVLELNVLTATGVCFLTMLIL